MKLSYLAVLASLLLGMTSAVQAAAPAAAAAASPVLLVGEVKLDKTVVENGQEKHVLSDPKTVLPGDRLIFTTRYRNAGAVPVNNFVVTNPLPGPVALDPSHVSGLTVSVDGGKSWGALAALTVPDGKGGRRPAIASEVTHIRWILPVVAPGASGAVIYHGVVR